MVNFKNAVIILTSNIGSATILESMSRGDFEAMKQQVTQQVCFGFGSGSGWEWCALCVEESMLRGGLRP